MKKRVISGLVGLLLLVGIMLLDKTFLGITIAFLSIVGLYEFYQAVAVTGLKPIRLLGYISCLVFIPLTFGVRPILKMFPYFDTSKFVFLAPLVVFVYIIILMLFTVFSRRKYNIIDVSVTLFGVLYVVFFFSFIVLTRWMPHGMYLVWFIFIGSFVTDTSAYFSGVLLGRTKIIPEISPKKTLEGSIGGVVGCILVTTIYGIALNRYTEIHISISNIVLLGALNGMFSQIGDWVASSIKRHVNIKDYGNIMPGHGGVLDRFDSLLFIAPSVYFYLNLIVL